jgi:hypothetical protein
MSISACAVKYRVRGFVWFGSLSYRRLHITYESRKLLCPLCKHELEPARYFGSKVFQHNLQKSDYKANFWGSLCENDECVWYLALDLKKHEFDW